MNPDLALALYHEALEQWMCDVTSRLTLLDHTNETRNDELRTMLRTLMDLRPRFEPKHCPATAPQAPPL